MRRAVLTFLVVTMARSAFADPHLSIHADREADPNEPTLTLDPMVSSHLVGLTNVETHEQAQFMVGDIRVAAESVTSENVDTPFRVALDVPTRGWQTSFQLNHDFGWARLSATATIGNVQTPYGQGTYRDLAIALSRTHRFTRWMTGWISLALANRTWLGDKPPPGEANGTTLTLSVGTTFK